MRSDLNLAMPRAQTKSMCLAGQRDRGACGIVHCIGALLTRGRRGGKAAGERADCASHRPRSCQHQPRRSRHVRVAGAQNEVGAPSLHQLVNVPRHRHHVSGACGLGQGAAGAWVLMCRPRRTSGPVLGEGLARPARTSLHAARSAACARPCMPHDLPARAHVCGALYARPPPLRPCAHARPLTVKQGHFCGDLAQVVRWCVLLAVPRLPPYKGAVRTGGGGARETLG